VVRVRGLVLRGYEYIDLTGPDCYYVHPVCLWLDPRLVQFGAEADAALFATVQPGLEATVIGEFRSREGVYCHQGSRESELVVFAVEAVKRAEGPANHALR
jgi:hypothetical protein